MPLGVFVPARAEDLALSFASGVDSAAAGALLYRNGSSRWASLAAGTGSQYLAGGTTPVWTAFPTTLSGDVILAPASSTRNVIQATGNFTALVVKNNGSQTVPPFVVQSSGGATLASFEASGSVRGQLAEIGTLPGAAASSYQIEVTADQATTATLAALVNKVDGTSKYGYSELHFPLYNPSASPTVKDHWSVGAQGTYNNAGTLSGYDWYVFDYAAGSYALTITGGTNRADFTGNVILNNSNRLGIGTGSPSRALHILHAQPLRMGTSGDYVEFLQRNTNVWSWFLATAGSYAENYHTSFGTVGIGASRMPDDSGQLQIYPDGGWHALTTFDRALGYGALSMYGISSTSAEREQARLSSSWATSTDASRKGRFTMGAADNTTLREVLRGETSGTAAMIGFLGAAAVARPTAYTQTYATATRTHANFTSSDLTGITSSTTGSALAEPSAAYTQSEQQQNFRRIQDQFVLLRADLANLKQVINSVIDDQQSNGLFA